MYCVLVDWVHWNDVCDFLSSNVFGEGVYLNEMTGEILPEGATSAIMGVVVKGMDGTRKLIKQGEMIWYESTGWYMIWDNERHGMDYFARDFK